MKILRNIILVLLVLIIITGTALYFIYNNQISAVDKNSNANIEVVIPSGTTTKEIGKILKDKDLIHSEFFYMIYLKLNNVNSLKSSTYVLKKSMNLKEILTVLEKGNAYNPDQISLTFIEGSNMRKIAAEISKKTVNGYEDVLNLLKDEEYINSLINNYWFLTDEIKNKDIYYPLEGYLAPNTYEFKNSDVSTKEIFKTLLDATDTILSKEKKNIEESGYTVHQLLTLASMVELEVNSEESRKGVAGVFINRLKRNMSLGSDVTTYYAIKADSEQDVINYTSLHGNPYTTYNPYNTRGSNMEGKLPVGPVCNPSSMSVNATINYTPTDYLFFVTGYDEEKFKNGVKYINIYYTKTNAEHEQKVNELKSKGLFVSW